MRGLEDFSSKKRRELALGTQEDAEENFHAVSTFKIEECWWHIFSEEIFPRLPANQLQTLKTVCKNWFRTITSPNFVGLHLKIYNENRIRVIIERNYEILMIEETKLQIIDYPSPIANPGSSILGSCDGLLCFKSGVYNPSTGKYFKVQFKDVFLFSYSWFGHHPCSGEYVLVLGRFGYEVGVYKFNNSSYLEKIHSTSRFLIDPQDSFTNVMEIGTLFHGAVHWPSSKWDVNTRLNSGYVISAYHLDANTYFEVSPPVQNCDFKLGVVEGCLFAILKPATNAEFEMWIMKDYGVQQSWVKYANILGFNSYRELSPLGFFPNGDLILDAGNIELIKYSFNDKKHELLMDHKFGVAIMCADSLVSPEIVGGGV